MAKEIQFTDADAVRYLEEKYGTVGKVFFDWQQGLDKDESNKPYINMNTLTKLADAYGNGHLIGHPFLAATLVGANQADMNTLINSLKQFEKNKIAKDALDYLEKTYGTVGKIVFDWQQELTKDDDNEPYVNMNISIKLADAYESERLVKLPTLISSLLGVKQTDINTLITNLKQFEQTNSVVDKMQKMRDSQVSPTDSSKNKPTN